VPDEHGGLAIAEKGLKLRRGESLWRIARRQLGSGHKWRALYEANKDRIGGDPDYIRAGTRLILPG